MPAFDGRYARCYIVRGDDTPGDPTGDRRSFLMAVCYYRAIKGRRRCISPSPKLRKKD